MIALRNEISSTEKKLFLKPRANNLQSTVRTESELRKRTSNCQFQLYQQKRRHHHQLAALLEEFCSSAWKHVLIDLTHARRAARVRNSILARVAVGQSRVRVSAGESVAGHARVFRQVPRVAEWDMESGAARRRAIRTPVNRIYYKWCCC